MCLELCMATYTGMDFWMDCDFEELLEYHKDAMKIIKDAKLRK